MDPHSLLPHASPAIPMPPSSLEQPRRRRTIRSSTQKLLETTASVNTAEALGQSSPSSLARRQNLDIRNNNDNNSNNHPHNSLAIAGHDNATRLCSQRRIRRSMHSKKLWHDVQRSALYQHAASTVVMLTSSSTRRMLLLYAFVASLIAVTIIASVVGILTTNSSARLVFSHPYFYFDSQHHHHHYHPPPMPHTRDVRQHQRRRVALPLRDFYGPIGPDYGRLHFDSLQFWTEQHRWARLVESYSFLWYEEDRAELLSEMDKNTDESWDYWEEMDHPPPPHLHHRHPEAAGGAATNSTTASSSSSSTEGPCYRLKWTSSHHPTCNLFHEINLGREVQDPHDHDNQNQEELEEVDHDKDSSSSSSRAHPDVSLQQYRRKYLAHGYYRDSWLLEPVWDDHHHHHHNKKHNKKHNKHHHNDKEIHENLVLKALRLTNSDLDYSWWTAHHMFQEALVMERTSSSNRTMNIYGHCYTSMLVEQGFEISQRIVQGVEYHGRGRIRQEELDRLQEKEGNVVSFNEFSPEEKLEIALAMAEGLAEMHGHAEGVIVNDDVHPDQFLVNKDGLVKFNDMNNAHILEWNPIQQKYCKYAIWIGGDYRSPEEMRGDPVDEKSDVWPMGALMFGLLTGLFPYYTVWDTREVGRIVASGEPPYLEPRWKTNKSYIEGRIVDIMERCWSDVPEERASIFEVVQHLRETQRNVTLLKQQGLADWSTKHAGLVPKESIPSPDYEKYWTDDGDSSSEDDEEEDEEDEKHQKEDVDSKASSSENGLEISKNNKVVEQEATTTEKSPIEEKEEKEEEYHLYHGEEEEVGEEEEGDHHHYGEDTEEEEGEGYYHDGEEQ